MAINELLWMALKRVGLRSHTCGERLDEGLGRLILQDPRQRAATALGRIG